MLFPYRNGNRFSRVNKLLSSNLYDVQLATEEFACGCVDTGGGGGRGHAPVPSPGHRGRPSTQCHTLTGWVPTSSVITIPLVKTLLESNSVQCTPDALGFDS